MEATRPEVSFGAGNWFTNQRLINYWVTYYNDKYKNVIHHAKEINPEHPEQFRICWHKRESQLVRCHGLTGIPTCALPWTDGNPNLCVAMD
jgi:hypothetical protein